MKRLFDLVLASVLLIIFFPLLFLVPIIVRVMLGSPIFFRQQRPGLHGKPFNIVKFRSMRDEFNGNGELLPDVERLSPFGRLLRRSSLDELPQLWNVLKGELSFVGPRPLLMEYLSLYSDDQARRHEVKPGITGWAQVNGRNAISWEEKFEYDVWYVDHYSFLLDLKILWMTLLKVVRSEGVSQEDHVTMEKFRGSGR